MHEKETKRDAAGRFLPGSAPGPGRPAKPDILIDGHVTIDELLVALVKAIESVEDAVTLRHVTYERTRRRHDEAVERACKQFSGVCAKITRLLNERGYLEPECQSGSHQTPPDERGEEPTTPETPQ